MTPEPPCRQHDKDGEGDVQSGGDRPDHVGPFRDPVDRHQQQGVSRRIREGTVERRLGSAGEEPGVPEVAEGVAVEDGSAVPDECDDMDECDNQDDDCGDQDVVAVRSAGGRRKPVDAGGVVMGGDVAPVSVFDDEGESSYRHTACLWWWIRSAAREEAIER